MNHEYYIHDRAANDSHPLIKGQDGEPRMELFHGVEVDLSQFDEKPLRLSLARPVPKKPVMADYHIQPDPVISPRLRDVLAPLNLHKVQLVPAVIEVKNKSLPYYYVNNYNRVSCVDEKRSNVKFNDDHNRLTSIKSLVLDEDVLSQLPLEQRLYFVLEEEISTYVVHQTVKDAIMAIAPEGIRFWKVADWSDSAQFG